MPSFLVKTLGCKANLTDSLDLARELRARGWSDASVDCRREHEALDLCIINSCTVTDEADRQSRAMASRLARLYPEARIVVTGCAAEIDPERIAGSRGIDYVVGARDRSRLVELVLERLGQPREGRGEVLGRAEGYEEIASRHPLDREWPSLDEAWVRSKGSDESHTRAFLKIQEGCNSFCTYCIIPYGRGPSRSLDPSSVVSRIRQVCASGTREVVLTGTNIGDYGFDLGAGHSLEALVRAILDETPLERLRLSSLDPVEVTPGILELIEREPRVCPHLHVSLQSIRDRVLRLMKRKYTAAQARECLEAIARLKPKAGTVFVGMDVIAGFPGETDAEFETGYALLESLPWTRLHVFPYSERSATPATRLPGRVPQGVRSERVRLLGELSHGRVAGVYERVLRAGMIENVLLEKPQYLKELKGEWMRGYSPSYVRVHVPAREGFRNCLASVIPRRVVMLAGEASIEASWN